MDLNGKLVLLTGGTDGIGLRLARQLREKGAQVVVTGRTPERIAAAQAEGFEVLAADLATSEGVTGLLAAVAGRPIDVLVNNAGMGTPHDYRVATPDAQADERTLQLNVHAPIRLIAGLIEPLKARPEAMIVNVTSGLAIAPNTASAIYCATKAALRSYTMSLRKQLEATRIHVLEVLPPVVETAMTADLAMKKLAPEACAAEIVRAMERNADEANVGQVKFLRRVYSLSPALARRIMLAF
ncbi:SDR family oxidoreductase [Novosphingobium olei]|uniref:SDR family NAD(P)-dependent oxidoreductase n=1 Tax=Novosphingobium olei TaxID=2728851 RepID=A0A7Y0BQZ1_9SPHN|nr:SDR family NAD(P)-dependent oxidoreductase [Novosphingobium olei]NML94909.1 SDR family NAD(P)-dependent oxidoreductase [Novosphingobium olei]